LHGSLDAAHARVAKALAPVAASAGPEDAAWALKFQLLDAEILTYQGRPREVLALLTATGIDYPPEGDAAIERNLLCGLAHAGVGDAHTADRELGAARHLAEVSRSPRIGEVLRAEAEVQVLRNAPATAEELFKQSLKVAREQRDVYLEASDLLNIGFVKLELEHYDEALGRFSESAALAERIGARTVVEAALGNVGWAFYYLGDFERALANFQRAEREAQEIGTTSAQIDWLQSTGLAYFKLDDLDQALAFDDKARVAAYSLNSREQIVEIETDLAFLSLRQGHDVLAQQHVDAAAKSLYPTDRSTALRIRLVQALLEARRDSGVKAVTLLVALHAEVDTDNAAAADPALRWQIENALAHVYADRHDAGQAEQWYRRSIDTFENRRASVTDDALKLSFFANGATLYRDYAGFLIATDRSTEALRLLDRGRARTLEEGLGATTTLTGVDPQTVAQRLDATILFYSLGADKSYLWAVTAMHTELFVLPSQATIEALLRTHKKSIMRSSDPLHEASDAAQALYDTLVAPAAALIRSGSRVTVIPDGMLYELDFDTLVKRGADGLHYWIDDVAVSTLSSIGMQAVAGARAATIARAAAQTTSHTLLLIGDPATRGTEFEELPNAAAEVTRIEQYFSERSSKVLTRDLAEPAAYGRSDPGRFEYIHFVAHGTASRLSPLESAVVLSPPADDPSQFKLYARDIVRYPLNARLVTVSACNGSGLRAYDGEGLVGLSWAFLRAGAHNVISSLWEVDDAATLELMDRLYRELKQGAAPDAALRAAKLSLIHSSGVYRKPFYWGAFQLYAGA